MELRDQIAIAVLQAILTNQYTVFPMNEKINVPEDFAKQAYRMADLMLKARDLPEA